MPLTLSEINNDPSYSPNDWIYLEDGEFAVKRKPLFSAFYEWRHARKNRDLLAKVFSECVEEGSTPGKVRRVWKEVVPEKRSSLPKLIARDSFLRMYAEGSALTVGIFREVWQQIHEESSQEEENPISIELHPEGPSFHGVQATPPGIAAKLSKTIRISKDDDLIEKIQEDLEKVATFKDRDKRRALILAILSHGAAYRELHGKTLRIPSLVARKSERLIEYTCTHHLLGEGVKTISLRAEEENEPGIYLCQGTEMWPSQPSMIGSIYSNFGKEGSATEPFALSRRLIEKHLKELAKDDLLPYVAGHSMGGALATQISLYLNQHIRLAYAFNPPVVGESDHDLYHRLEDKDRKLRLFVNIDDFAFWRIGSHVIGKVTLLMGNQRWEYYPFVIWDFLLIIPSLIKGLVNYFNAFPTHQNIIPLYENYVVIPLTEEEVEIENADRGQRFGQFHFMPHLHTVARLILRASRSIFRWSLLEEYLKTKIEEIDLEVEELNSLIDKNEDLIDADDEVSEKEEIKSLLKQQIEVRLTELEEQKAEFERKLQKYL